MEEQTYIRARSAEQKQERMDAIMAAADELFAEMPYHKITMGLIAERLGWSRAGLYKYAGTQEEIFLALHERENRAWIGELVSALADAPMDNVAFARTWVAVTARHGSFLRYQDILISIIESNVSLERLTAFKRSFAEMLAPMMELLARQCCIADDAAVDLYLRLLFQAPKLWQHYHCAELTREAMARAGLPPVEGSFEDAYADYTEMCLEYASRQYS